MTKYKEYDHTHDQKYTGMELPSGPVLSAEEIERTPNPDDPVRFGVFLYDVKDSNFVKDALENLADDIVIQHSRRGTLRCMTGYTTYETVFNTELAYLERNIPDLLGNKTQRFEWREKDTARIPDGLEDKVKYIGVEIQFDYFS